MIGRLGFCPIEPITRSEEIASEMYQKRSVVYGPTEYSRPILKTMTEMAKKNSEATKATIKVDESSVESSLLLCSQSSFPLLLPTGTLEKMYSSNKHVL